MALEHNEQAAGPSESDQLYFIETFLRQRGDPKTLLAVDALVLRNDLAAEDKEAKLQALIQGALNGKQ